MDIKGRIKKLEKYKENEPDEFTTMYLCYGACDPTEEQIEAARKKFLDEHPGYLEGHSLVLLPLYGEEQIINSHVV